MRTATKTLNNPAAPKSASQVPRQRLSLNPSSQWATQNSPDIVISEEPLAIYLHWFEEGKGDCQTLFSITMRTPGDDENLVLGLLHADGVIRTVQDINELKYQESSHQGELLHHNQIDVFFRSGITPNHQLFQRQVAGNSSCGVCGKTSIKAIEMSLQGELDLTESWLSPQLVSQLPDKLREKQTLFEQTGGVHGVGLFNSQGELLTIKEDVGRHNALDKVLGFALSQEIDLSQSVIVLSGRVSFELVQKCVLASVPIIVAVGAPSNLAISTAQRFNLTLIGFCANQSMNVYHGDWRIIK